MSIQNKKIYLAIVVIILVFVTSFNLYMFMNRGNIKDDRIRSLEKEMVVYQKEIEKKNEKFKEVSEESYKKIRELDENRVINSTKRFFEFIYDHDVDNYVLRKKDATNYMSETLVERFFPSDNVVETGQTVEISDIEVYTKKEVDNQNNDGIKAIASYNLNVSLEENVYSEPVKVYMQVTLSNKDNKIIVENIEEFGNEGSVDYD